MIIEYNIKRSNRKSISLEITKTGSLLVRAPIRLSDYDIQRFVQKHNDWISVHLQKQKMKVSSQRELTAEDIQKLKSMAKEYLPEKTTYYSQIMGVTPSGVKITSAKTRFGSCSGKDSICFSWRLMLYPIDAVDYVIVHELAHILYKNHGKAFYEFISSVIPDYKERRKLLKGSYENTD